MVEQIKERERQIIVGSTVLLDLKMAIPISIHCILRLRNGYNNEKGKERVKDKVVYIREKESERERERGREREGEMSERPFLLLL